MFGMPLPQMQKIMHCRHFAAWNWTMEVWLKDGK